MNFLTHDRKGIIYAIASGLCFGLLGYFGITLMDAHLSVYNMLFWRFAVGAGVIFLSLIPTYKTIFQQPRESLRVVFYGILFYAPTAVLYFIACQSIGTGLAMVTFFVYPVIVILLNKFLYKAPIPASYYGAVILILIGMCLLGDITSATLNIYGILLGIASAGVYSLYVIASKRSTLGPLVSTFMVSIGSMITCFIAAYNEGSFFVPTGFSVWVKILLVGIICTALPMLFLLRALQYISAEKTALLSVLEPIFVVFFGIVLLHETINYLQIVGVAIILCGALVSLLSSRKADKKLSQKETE